VVSQSEKEQTDDVKNLVEIYKTLRDERMRLRKGIIDAYRIYIPALFGIMVTIGKVSITNDGYLTPIVVLIGFFILVTYGQILYDLTDMAYIDVQLGFIEKLIKDKFGEDIVTLSKEFSEPFKMINPQNIIEKGLKHFYVWTIPILIALVWSYLVISILGFQNNNSKIISTLFFVMILALTWLIGKRRLDYALKFASKKLKNK